MNSPTEWTSRKVVFYGKYTSIDICIYGVCDKIKQYLVESNGLFDWKYPDSPDDVSLFKSKNC